MEVECGQDTIGLKRKAGKHMDFNNYEICNEERRWESKACQESSIFWSLISCCVPLGLFPIPENCL